MDGIFAAYIAGLSLPAKTTEFHPHSTTKTFELTQIPETVEELYLLDYCGPQGFIERACERFKKVILIDHHQTAVDYIQKDMPKNFEKFVRMDHSGCMLAYMYFKAVGISQNMQMLLAYVEDNDLWRHVLPKSEEFTAGLMSLKLDPTTAMFDIIPTLDLKELVALGAPEIHKRNAYVDEHVKRITFHVLPDLYDNKQIALLQFEKVPDYISYLGGRVCQLAEAKVGIVSFPLADGMQIKLSVRSEGEVSTLPFVSKYHGGGHKNASGCAISKAEFQDLFYSK
jgi:oligoribonuclease NrnB/cAMP/cGMP phosphodiesterase (DHH superfamily)